MTLRIFERLRNEYPIRTPSNIIKIKVNMEILLFYFAATPANTDRARHNFLFFTYTIQKQITHNTNQLRYIRKIKRPYRPDDFHILLSI